MKINRALAIRKKNIIAGRVRLARLSFTKPLTQDQLAGKLAAKQLSLDRVAIAKIETNARCVYDHEIPILADVLRVDVRWLLGMQKSGRPAGNSEESDGF